MEKTPTFTPTKQSERIVTLDVIRAIALFGILLVNMKFFSTPAIQAEMANISYANSILDKISEWFIFLFAEVKFVSMFSMLFGIGFLLFMERGERRGLNVKKFFKRRLWVLLVFGLIHLFFFWYGDILTFYALTGFILLLVKGKGPKFFLKAAFITISIPVILFSLLALMMSQLEQGLPDEQQVVMENEVARVGEVYSQGSFVDILVQRITDVSLILVGNVFLLLVVLTMFFVGMYFWKTGIFTNTTENIHRIRKMAATVLGFALVGTVIAVTGKIFNQGGNSPWYFVQYAGLFINGPSVSVFYVMSLLLIFENKKRLAKVARFLQPVGRMALTNYLTQTIICTFLFYGYGLGFFGSIGAFYGILLTIAIYSVQIVYSSYWLKKFNYGPMEWLWRRLTYGKMAVNKNVLSKAQ